MRLGPVALALALGLAAGGVAHAAPRERPAAGKRVRGKRRAAPVPEVPPAEATPEESVEQAATPEVAPVAPDAASPQPQVASEPPSGPRHAETNPSELLAQELALLEQRRLAPAAATRVDELDQLLELAYQRERNGRRDEAAMMLLEAVEGPRFRAFSGLASFAAAELMLGSLLLDLGALQSAERVLDALLARGADSATFGPALRRSVDLALARGDYAASAERLARDGLPPDAQSELHYLRALAERDAGELESAARELAGVQPSSRFYVRAQYLLGAQAAADQRWDEADARFRTARRLAPRTLYASSELDPSSDLAQLGRARVAHERGESKRAADFYFGVPSDSPFLPEALFESAFASYERARPELALDTLAQLEARYPGSPYTAEAHVLRGYLHLASFDFARAEAELVEFERTFALVLQELDETLASPARLRSLFAEQAVGLPAAASKHDALLRGLLLRDPAVERAQRRLDLLDAELARGSQLDVELRALAARVRGQELPRERNDDEAVRALSERERAHLLSEAVVAFADDLRSLRRAGAERAELGALEKIARKLSATADQLEAAARAGERTAIVEAPVPSGVQLGERVDQERAYASAARARALSVRERLFAALSEAQHRALSALRERLLGELRRARIGRIDAVMGQKRKLELEVESLNAGRFPPELVSRRRTPVYLRDDEEYWPFEGEDWPDEHEQRGPR